MRVNFYLKNYDLIRYKISLVTNFVTVQEIGNANDKLVWAILRGHYSTVRVVLSTTNADVYPLLPFDPSHLSGAVLSL